MPDSPDDVRSASLEADNLSPAEKLRLEERANFLAASSAYLAERSWIATAEAFKTISSPIVHITSPAIKASQDAFQAAGDNIAKTLGFKEEPEPEPEPEVLAAPDVFANFFGALCLPCKNAA